MKKIESVLIAGAGAIGLTVAETIHSFDPRCISILAGGERLERYRRDGLWINGKKIDFTLADAGVKEAAAADLIIIASKYHHLQRIISDIKPYVGGDTIIVSLLNGISSEEIIGRAYGRQRLPLAMIIGTDAQHKGNQTSFSLRGLIHFGDAEGKDTPRDRSIAEFFGRAGLAFEYHPQDMKRTLWFKFMVNVGVNQVSAVLRLSYGAFKRLSPPGIPEARELLESAMAEVIAIAAAEGISLGQADIAGWYETVEALGDKGYTSMCQDVLAGRKTEVEMFARVVMEYGKKHGVPTPVNEILYRELRAIEQAYAS
ncbi:MAG: 2-dehydropantoate 2-reductase [Spirochaetales bacterium]|jgi:2-dehydropantoate 2-reductase|nr:2-dehydropantoate 2-reductase [Spirochaetales bacterium]